MLIRTYHKFKHIKVHLFILVLLDMTDCYLFRSNTKPKVIDKRTNNRSQSILRGYSRNRNFLQMLGWLKTKKCSLHLLSLYMIHEADAILEKFLKPNFLFQAHLAKLLETTHISSSSRALTDSVKKCLRKFRHIWANTKHSSASITITSAGIGKEMIAILKIYRNILP